MKTNNIEPLKEQFSTKKDGTPFNFEQVKKETLGEETYYIYQVSIQNSSTVYYEGFLERIKNKIQNVDGKIVKLEELKVAYPSNEAFGIWAWTHPKYENIESILINHILKSNKKNLCNAF